MSDIVLSAGVRKNLLALQNTADLRSTTQNRLATGKKVNSALDNPVNFFTSQSLSQRASDLNALLDSIGQGQKTLEAASNGITSLSKLVESAKSAAQQAHAAPKPNATYNGVAASGTTAGEIFGTLQGRDLSPKAVNLSFTTQGQTIGSIAGAASTGVGVGHNGNVLIDITYRGTVYSFDTGNLTNGAQGSLANLATAIGNATTGSPPAGVTKLSDLLNISTTGGKVTLTAKDADTSFAIDDVNSNALVLTDAGLNSGARTGSGTSVSLFNNIATDGGAAGNTLIVNVNGVPKTATFGNGVNQIATLAQFNAWLSSNSGAATGGVAGTTFSLALGAGATNSIALTATNEAVKQALGVDSAIAGYNFGSGARGGLGNSPANLTKTFHSNLTLAEVDPTNLSAGGNLTITLNNNNNGLGPQTQVIALNGTDTVDNVVTALKANATLDTALNISTVAGKLTVTSKSADTDFTVSGSFTSAALGVTLNNTVDSDNSGFASTGQSTSLLDRIINAGGAAGETLTVKANNGITQTITFGTGTNQVSTLTELQSALSGLSGVTTSLVGNAINLQVASGPSQTSLTLGGGTNAITVLGLTGFVGTNQGTATPGADNATRTSLQADYNNILLQINQLAKDSSYNGINLLYGDDLKIVFNGDASSSLTIQGVQFDSAGLALSAVNGSNGAGFQDDNTVDLSIAALDAALSKLRTQVSKFGANLTTVETRQDFTKNMINTLQTGADNLTLADTNAEGANMLALQTRQQLSTTALSLSAQADQAVLRLFG